jgi:phosphoglycolate phosphatase-like HAD superfamily hydrolase
MKKLVLFDIDGTILLSAGAGRRAIVAALAADVGTHPAWEHIRFDGKTDPQIIFELLEAAGEAGKNHEARLRAFGERYVALLREELGRPGHRTTLMPGIPPLLDRVGQDDVAVLGLLTGNFAEGAALKLESGGIDPRRFKVGAYGSDSARRSELPPIAAERAGPMFGRIPRGPEVVIVGDTPSDVTCGQCIGARAIGVATGAYSTGELAAAGAHAVFEDLSDTEAVLQAIFQE